MTRLYQGATLVEAEAAAAAEAAVLVGHGFVERSRTVSEPFRGPAPTAGLAGDGAILNGGCLGLFLGAAVTLFGGTRRGRHQTQPASAQLIVVTYGRVRADELAVDR